MRKETVVNLSWTGWLPNNDVGEGEFVAVGTNGSRIVAVYATAGEIISVHLNGLSVFTSDAHRARFKDGLFENNVDVIRLPEPPAAAQ